MAMYSVVILFHFCQNVAKLEGILCCKRHKKKIIKLPWELEGFGYNPFWPPSISALYRDLYLRKMKIVTHYFVLRFEFFSLDSKCVYDKLLKSKPNIISVLWQRRSTWIFGEISFNLRVVNYSFFWYWSSRKGLCGEGAQAHFPDSGW